MYVIQIPDTVRTGGILEVKCIGYIPKKTAFTALLGVGPTTKTIDTAHGQAKKSTAQWVQIEQENSAQEVRQNSRDDGVIHFELLDKKGKPIKPGKYLLKAVAASNVGPGKAEVSKIVDIIG